MRAPPPSLLLGLLVLSCGSTLAFTSRRLDDGSVELRCRTGLAECLAHFDDLCIDSAYEVLSAHDERHPVDVQVGSYQRQTRSSDAHVRCGRFAPPPSAPSPAAPAAPAHACVPGATQTCVGLGACAGGQSCLADGSGFGPCNCAPAAAPAPARDGGVGQ